MKYVQLTVHFFIFLFFVLIPLNASADIFSNDKKKWDTVFKRLQLIATHLENLETSEMARLRSQLEDLLRQVEEIKQTFPQLQNAVELNKSETLAQVNKVETKISDLQAEVKDQLLFKIIQQKNILDKIQEDQKKFKIRTSSGYRKI